ncbi:hypothetical protein I317_02334 [Kwoniella heveanensis CBS 569]|nr:hypothetical protein I317_02334 [Kwoniella heveanensis CBS 569]
MPRDSHRRKDDNTSGTRMSGQPSSMRHKTLSAYYPSIQSLDTLLSSSVFSSESQQRTNTQRIVPPPFSSGSDRSSPWSKATDTKAYTNLLEDTLCCFPSTQARSSLISKILEKRGRTSASLAPADHRTRSFGSTETATGTSSVVVAEPIDGRRRAEGTQQEAIDRILRDLGRAAFGTGGGKNVLLAGNRYSAYELPVNLVRPHVENRYVHSPASVLRQTTWKLLRSRIGDEAFRLILTHASIFLPVGNNCYTQLTGEPIYDLYDRSQVIRNKDKNQDQDQDRAQNVIIGNAVHRWGTKRRRKASSCNSRKRVKSDPATEDLQAMPARALGSVQSSKTPKTPNRPR